MCTVEHVIYLQETAKIFIGISGNDSCRIEKRRIIHYKGFPESVTVVGDINIAVKNVSRYLGLLVEFFIVVDTATQCGGNSIGISGVDVCSSGSGFIAGIHFTQKILNGKILIVDVVVLCEERKLPFSIDKVALS